MAFKTPLLVSIVLAGSLAISPNSNADQADLDREIDQLLRDFDTRDVPADELAERIKWSGISDTRLFDPIEARLLEKSQEITRLNVQYLSWLVQLLAFSGQMKYFDTLQHISQITFENRTARNLAHHTKSSLTVLPDFARWNPIIARNLADVPKEKIPVQRVLNMLTADEPALVTIGAKIAVKHRPFSLESEIFAVANQQLLERYQEITNDDEEQALSHLCKVLGESRDRQYLTTLEKVKAEVNSRAVKGWAEKSIRRLYTSTN